MVYILSAAHRQNLHMPSPGCVSPSTRLQLISYRPARKLARKVSPIP